MNGTSNSIHMDGLQPQAGWLEPALSRWKRSGDRCVAFPRRFIDAAMQRAGEGIGPSARALRRSERRPGAVSAVGDARGLEGPVRLFFCGNKNLGAGLQL